MRAGGHEYLYDVARTSGVLGSEGFDPVGFRVEPGPVLPDGERLESGDAGLEVESLQTDHRPVLCVPREVAL